MDEQAALWERQPWDTDASFARFHTYYLAQERPRSIDEAYRRHYAELRGLPMGHNQVTEKRAPGQWRRWARGQNGKGQPIPGAKSWEARAAAYDDHLAAQDRQRWEQRHRQLRELDWTVGTELRDLAAEILSHTPQFLKTTRRLVRGGEGHPDQIVTTVELDGAFLLKALKLASELQHQATEITPVQHHEHTVSGTVAQVNLTADEYAALRKQAEERARQFEEDLIGDDDDGRQNTRPEGHETDLPQGDA